MAYKTDLEIETLLTRFSDTTLPKDAWTHGAHFAVALALLRKYGAQTFKRMPPMIRRYNEATGVPNSDSDGYHETITMASLRVAQHFLDSAEKDAPLAPIVTRLLASPYGRADWLFRHWRKQTIFTPKARHQWVEPDIAPLPF